jgi:hypothetical protein
MSVDRVIALFEAGRTDEGRALARELDEEQIPALEEAMDTTLLDPRLALVDALQVERADLELALEIMADQVTPLVEDEIERLAESLEGEKHDLELWRVQTEPRARRSAGTCRAGSALLLATRDGELGASDDAEAIESGIAQWIEELAFRELEPSDTPLSRYAVIARFYEARFGPSEIVARRVSRPPTSGAIDHAER